MSLFCNYKKIRFPSGKLLAILTYLAVFDNHLIAKEWLLGRLRKINGFF